MMGIILKKDSYSIDTDNAINEAFADNIHVRIQQNNQLRTFLFPYHKNGNKDREGRIAHQSVSRSCEVELMYANQPLHLHITFFIKQIWVPGRVAALSGKQAIRVEMVNPHLTLRPKSAQEHINDDNLIARIYSSFSIHRGAKPEIWKISDEKRADLMQYLRMDEHNNEHREALTQLLHEHDVEFFRAVVNGLTQSLIVEIRDNLDIESPLPVDANTLIQLRDKVRVEVDLPESLVEDLINQNTSTRDNKY